MTTLGKDSLSLELHLGRLLAVQSPDCQSEHAHERDLVRQPFGLGGRQGLSIGHLEGELEGELHGLLFKRHGNGCAVPDLELELQVEKPTLEVKDGDLFDETPVEGFARVGVVREIAEVFNCPLWFEDLTEDAVVNMHGSPLYQVGG